MNARDLALQLRAMGEVVHESEHAIAVRLGGDGRVVVAMVSEVRGDDWVELRLWAASRASAPVDALLMRNARLAYGAFCVVDDEIYLRAALALDDLRVRELGRAIATLVAEADLLERLTPDASAVHDAFGHLA